MTKIISADVYEYILSRMTERLEKEGFVRSGKSSFFYRYSDDRTSAAVIGFQKSVNNGPDWLRFRINYDFVTVLDIEEFWNEHLTLRILKDHLRGTFRGTEWYEISEYTLVDRTLEEYYKQRIEPDLEYSIKSLNHDLKGK